MNIFEGARRIAILIFCFIFLGGIIAIYDMRPNVVIKYRILFFGATPLKIDGCDEVFDAKRYNKYTTPNGRPFSIRTCFKASKADNGRLLIPYADAPNNMVYMNSEYSDEVRSYTESVADSIAPTSSDFEEADAEYIRQAWVGRLQGLAWLIGGLFAYWMAVRTIGWVVRGFMGIPSGYDYRISPIEK
jgi:hypothetical protein